MFTDDALGVAPKRPTASGQRVQRPENSPSFLCGDRATRWMNGGNNGVDRDRESRRDSTQSIGRLPKPADWKRRLRRRPSSATVHLFRQTVEVDIESVKSLFMAPAAGWLNRTHCHGVQREEEALQLQCLACIPTEVFQTNLLPAMLISVSAGVASMQTSQGPQLNGLQIL